MTAALLIIRIKKEIFLYRLIRAGLEALCLTGGEEGDHIARLCCSSKGGLALEQKIELNEARAKVRHAYKAASRQLHPDKCPHPQASKVNYVLLYSEEKI